MSGKSFSREVQAGGDRQDGGEFAEFERKVGQQQVGLELFQECFAAYPGVAPTELWSWCDGAFAHIHAMTGPRD